MTKTIRFGVAGIAMFAALGLGSTAHAQDTATATAEAEVLEAIDIRLVGGILDFGSLVVTGPGSVTLTPLGARDCSATTVTCVDTPTNPQFEVTGTAGRGVTVTLPSTDVTLTNTAAGSTDTMTLNGFTSSEGTAITLDASGAELFTVGGTLNFVNGQDAGIYRGTFDVSVDYS